MSEPLINPPLASVSLSLAAAKDKVIAAMSSVSELMVCPPGATVWAIAEATRTFEVAPTAARLLAVVSTVSIEFVIARTPTAGS